MKRLKYGDIKKSDLKKVKEITLKEARDLKFNAFVILPNNHIHDSGYRCFDLILLDQNIILGRLVTWSDVLHLNGIGGYGEYGIDKSLVKNDWNFDIYKNGIIRVFTFNKLTLDDMLLSSFSIYQRREE